MLANQASREIAPVSAASFAGLVKRQQDEGAQALLTHQPTIIKGHIPPTFRIKGSKCPSNREGRKRIVITTPDDTSRRSLQVPTQ